MKTRPPKDVNSEIDETIPASVGSGSAGQSGDTQGLTDSEDTNAESVTELIEEGQYFEASVISGIENAPPADVAEVTTRQVRVDDVPDEYLEEDEPPN